MTVIDALHYLQDPEVLSGIIDGRARAAVNILTHAYILSKFEPYDFVRYEKEPNHFVVVDISDRTSLDAHGKLWRDGAIGNIRIRKPISIQGLNDGHWEVIKI